MWSREVKKLVWVTFVFGRCLLLRNCKLQDTRIIAVRRNCLRPLVAMYLYLRHKAIWLWLQSCSNPDTQWLTRSEFRSMFIWSEFRPIDLFEGLTDVCNKLPRPIDITPTELISQEDQPISLGDEWTDFWPTDPEDEPCDLWPTDLSAPLYLSQNTPTDRWVGSIESYH